MSRKKIKNTFIEILSLVFSLAFVIPAWFVVVNSLKSRQEANQFNLSLPSEWRIDNYITVIQEGGIFRAMVNGVLLSTITCVLVILICSLASFYIVRSRSKLAKAMYYYFLSGTILPISMISTYMVLVSLKLNNTYIGLILEFTALTIPVSIFMYTSYIKSIPRELDEAAIIDGCGSVNLFYKIILPLLKPITITVIITNFIGVWNNVDVQLFFADSDKWTMPMTLYKFYGIYASDWNLVLADVVLTAAPVLLVYIVAQKYIVDGMVSGAVKG